MVGKDLPTGPLSHNVSILSTKAMWWHLGPPMPGKGPIHRPGKRAYTQAWKRGPHGPSSPES